jgi:Ca-activated chloride channel family protein
MASSSVALAGAFDTSIWQPSSPPTVETTFAVKSEPDGAPIVGPVEWTFINSETEEIQVLDDEGSQVVLDMSPGTYEVFVTAGDVVGEIEVEVVAGSEQRFEVSLRVTETPRPFDAPSSAPAGSALSFKWRGPDGEGDLIFIADSSMTDNRYPWSNRHETKNGETAFLTVPARPGMYEIRYFSMGNGTVLDRMPIEVTTAEVEIGDPPSISAGEILEFNWSGPNAPGDILFVASPDMRANVYRQSNIHQAKDGSPATMTAPAIPGDYEIRYFSMRNGTVLTSVPLSVTEPQVNLEAPRIAAPGSEVTVSWSGPQSEGDILFIVEKGVDENRYPLSRYHSASKGSPARLTVPAEPGTYEIRYFSKRNGISLASRALIVR